MDQAEKVKDQKAKNVKTNAVLSGVTSAQVLQYLTARGVSTDTVSMDDGHVTVVADQDLTAVFAAFDAEQVLPTERETMLESVKVKDDKTVTVKELQAEVAELRGVVARIIAGWAGA